MSTNQLEDVAVFRNSRDLTTEDAYRGGGRPKNQGRGKPCPLGRATLNLSRDCGVVSAFAPLPEAARGAVLGRFSR